MPFPDDAGIVKRRDDPVWSWCSSSPRWVAHKLNQLWTEAFAAGAIAALEKSNADPRPR